MIKRILAFLYQKGYVRFREDIKGVYIHAAGTEIYLVTLTRIADRSRLFQLKEKLGELQQRVEFLAASQYQQPVHTLHLITTIDGMFEEEEMELVRCLSNVWLIAEDTGKIYIFENQLQDFDCLHEDMEKDIRQYVIDRRKDKRQGFKVTPVNISIVIVNVLVFLAVILINGDYYAVYDSDMMRKGALSYHAFMNGAWYQIITSLFLHFGLSHLLSNIVLLTYIGCELERRIGSVSYFFLYFFTGICGNIVSLWYYNYVGEQTVLCAGASGAISGVLGALIVVLWKSRTKTGDLSVQRLLAYAGVLICYGLTTAGIDNAAHIGGLISGIISGFLLSKILQYGKLK